MRFLFHKSALRVTIKSSIRTKSPSLFHRGAQSSRFLSSQPMLKESNPVEEEPSPLDKENKTATVGARVKSAATSAVLSTAGRKSYFDNLTLEDFSRHTRPKPKKAKKGPGGSLQTPLMIYHKSEIETILKYHAPHIEWFPYRVAAEIFPMRINNYVLQNHIDWTDPLNDPYFKLVIPQPEMLSEEQRRRITITLNSSATQVVKQAAANKERDNMNPHPANQKTMNVPKLNGKDVKGLQHKYGETVLFFPRECQFCHTFCTYCFRWAQFTNVGSPQQFSSGDAAELLEYIKHHKHIKDLLITGGDAMIMNAESLAGYLEPLLDNPDTAHLQTIRFGTKSLAYWPYKFTDDDDAIPMLNLFKKIIKAGKHVSIQAHFTHPVELKTQVVKRAIQNIQATGAAIRTQSPLIRGINDKPEIWREMWNLQTKLGLQPYYMFVERDTGAAKYFRVPLVRCLEIFHTALKQVPGTARTVRGPSMSAAPGKISLVGISTIKGEKVFVLKFLQARNPNWCDEDKLFYAKYKEEAYWIDDLEPAFGEEKWFWQDEYARMEKSTSRGSSGQWTFPDKSSAFDKQTRFEKLTDDSSRHTCSDSP